MVPWGSDAVDWDLITSEMLSMQAARFLGSWEQRCWCHGAVGVIDEGLCER